MTQPRVLLGFADANNHDLEETAGHVLAGLFQSQLYSSPVPPLLSEVLQQGLTIFTTALAAQKEGGPLATAQARQARAALVTQLRQLAAYVQSMMVNHPAWGLAELLASGFDAVSSNRARHTLPSPSIRKIENAGEGALTLRLDAIRNARQYEVRLRTSPGGEWQAGQLFNSTQGMTVHSLTPGGLYDFQARALGGADGASGWSDTVSHRSL